MTCAKYAGATVAGIAFLLMLCVRADAASLRSFNFTYHADIPISNPSAKKIEIWIPLPREDAFQQVRDLKIDAPAHFEIVDQGSNGNRVAHLESLAPLPASVPVTIRFAVSRREQAANMVAAARDIPEPTDGRFAAYLEPNRLVPLTGRIAQVSAKLAETNVTPLQQARVDYEYVTSIMKYDKSGTGWGPRRRALRMRHATRQLHRLPFVVYRTGARSRNPRAVYDWLSARLGKVG